MDKWVRDMCHFRRAYCELRDSTAIGFWRTEGTLNCLYTNDISFWCVFLLAPLVNLLKGNSIKLLNVTMKHRCLRCSTQLLCMDGSDPQCSWFQMCSRSLKPWNVEAADELKMNSLSFVPYMVYSSSCTFTSASEIQFQWTQYKVFSATRQGQIYLQLRHIPKATCN